MIFNVLIFLLIVLVTMYLGTQGMVSSLLALATSIFSSILAMALTEPLQGIIGGFRPDYARGCTFLLLFLLIFSGTRIAADMVVKKNIRLNLWINRGVAAFIGFFTALVVIGTVIIGVEMFPVQRNLLGFHRFPDEDNGHVMQAMEDEKPLLGEAATRRNSIWFSPDGFVQAIWDAASNRSLGGSQAWGAVHPDLTAELYGYRYSVYPGSVKTVPQDFLKIQAIWTSTDPKDYPRGFPPDLAARHSRVVVVRSEVKKGDQPPKTAADSDGYFRVSMAQVRLVTDKGRQYYPVGDLVQGRTWDVTAEGQPLALDRGFVADEFTGGGPAAIEDWVFAIQEDEKPRIFEIKGARDEDLLSKLVEKPVAPPKVAEYPPRSYYKDLGNLTVTFDPVNKLISGRVYVLKADGKMRDVFGLFKPAYQNVLDIYKNMDAGAAGWTKPAKQGLPSFDVFRNYQNLGVQRVSDKDDSPVEWNVVLPTILLGETKLDPKQNYESIPLFMRRDVEKMWSDARTGSVISGMADAEKDESGTWRAAVKRISPVTHPIVVTMQTETGFYVWVTNHDFTPPTDPKQTRKDFAITASADPSMASNVTYHFDLDEAPR